MRIHIPQIVVQILKRSSGEHSVCVVAAATKFLWLSCILILLLNFWKNFSIYTCAEWSLAVLWLKVFEIFWTHCSLFDLLTFLFIIIFFFAPYFWKVFTTIWFNIEQILFAHKITVFEIKNLRSALLFIDLILMLIIQRTFLSQLPARNVCKRMDLSKLIFLENELVADIKLRNIIFN